MSKAVVIIRRATKIDTITIDSCLDETHQLSNTVTDHPVEEGYNATDHSRPNPDVVTLRCFVSNTPLSQEQTRRAVSEGNVDFDTSSAEDFPPIGDVDGRGDATFQKLQDIRLAGKLIEVVTTLKTYGVSATEGMMIESVTIPRTRQNYDGLEFTLQLKQVRIVKNKSTSEVRPKDKRTQKKKKQGQKPAPAATKPRDSYLSDITGIKG